MTHFIPREKLGKKARKRLDSLRRNVWDFSPVTRTVESKKVYNRKRKTRDVQNDWHGGFFMSCKTEAVLHVSSMCQPYSCKKILIFRKG